MLCQHMMMNVVTNASEAIPERSAGEVKVTVGRHALATGGLQRWRRTS